MTAAEPLGAPPPKASLFSANNVNMAAAPPSYFQPNANGVAVPVGLSSWLMSIISSKYAAGSLAAIAIEYLYGASWMQAGAETLQLGPYACDGGGIIGVTNTPNPTI